MYPLVLTLHSVVRWAIVIFGIVAAVRAWMGSRGGKPWTALDNSLGLGFTISLDVNLLLGLLLYLVFSPITKSAFSNFGAAMGNGSVRFFLVEHLLLMIVAVVVAHIGRARAKKATTDAGKFTQTGIFFTAALVLVLLAIPWPFLATGAGRGWF
ncbi:MAG TPA: hypothetical protein PKM78_02145 [Anaerolineae bacterium]|nr:hypothetical protein [Anaerolineae bacterium]HNU02800.1 hypothetical protein [Anaerolineae bacterium]